METYTAIDGLIVATLLIWAIADVYLVIVKKPTISDRITWIHKYKSPSLCLLIAYLFFHWFAK